MIHHGTSECSNDVTSGDRINVVDGEGGVAAKQARVVGSKRICVGRCLWNRRWVERHNQSIVPSVNRFSNDKPNLRSRQARSIWRLLPTNSALAIASPKYCVPGITSMKSGPHKARSWGLRNRCNLPSRLEFRWCNRTNIQYITIASAAINARFVTV